MVAAASGTTDGTVEDLRRELADARFDQRVADALTGSLNLRRTLARVADLAVPELGPWAGVTVWEAAGVHQASRGPGAARYEVVRERRHADPSLDELLVHPSRLAEIGAETLMALGADPAAAAALTAAETPSVELRPLRAAGRTVGLLAVALEPQSPVVLGRLQALAARAAAALAAAVIYEERTTLAATLRSSLLPAALPDVPGIQLGACYRPAEEAAQIGGDFYDVQPEGSAWSLTIGDVCGKGVSAAVLTGQARQSLRTVSLLSDDPGERIRLLNAALRSCDGRSFLTLVHATLRVVDDGLRLRVANGGHPPPLVRRRTGEVHHVAAKGTLVGMLPHISVEVAELLLEPGETLLCFTDGLTEARCGEGRLGPEPVARLLADCAGMHPQAVADRVMQLALECLDGRPHDDIAVLALRAPEQA